MEKLPKSEARYVRHANTRLGIIFVINCALLNITHGVPGQPDGGNTYFAGSAKTIRDLRLARELLRARSSGFATSSRPSGTHRATREAREATLRQALLILAPSVLLFPLISDQRIESAFDRASISLLRRERFAKTGTLARFGGVILDLFGVLAFLRFVTTCTSPRRSCRPLALVPIYFASSQQSIGTHYTSETLARLKRARRSVCAPGACSRTLRGRLSIISVAECANAMRMPKRQSSAVEELIDS